jgi:exodeoxyribonuclease V alpha subunit
MATGADGRLRELNRTGVLTAADVHVALRLGRLGGEDDEEVLVAAAFAVAAVRSGSVCLDLGSVPHRAPGQDWPDARRWLAAVESSPLVGTALHVDAGLLYLDRYWREESHVVEDLISRSAGPPPVVDEDALTAALDAHVADPAYADQRAAVEAACRHWTSVVTGGPGTGKTTTIARLLAVLMEVSGPQPIRVALAAPTGKAAARMAQAVREATEQSGFPADVDRLSRIRSLEASTLHRLLGWLPDNRTRFRHHRRNRLPHDVVIVDETSMISLTMMARLLEAVRPEARLVLVGDADQLASVDAGAVLNDLVEGYHDRPDSPVRRLTTTRRFGDRIGALADAVRSGDADAVLEELGRKGAEVVWLEESALPGLLARQALALRSAAESGGAAAALQTAEGHRLLCAHRQGPYGVGHWNRAVERLLMAATGRDWLDTWYAGQPLIVNSNDYGLGLFNGDTGVVCRSETGGLVAAIGDGKTGAGRAMPTSRLADVSTAHALTVHRSQGSQFDEVTVLLPEPSSRILTRELLYTAVTRARRTVRVVGSEEAIRAGVERRAQRATGLAHRLRSTEAAGG